jgi:ParB family chromosome partitioning protein
VSAVRAVQPGAIRVGERHRRDVGDIDALAASIADVGLLHPIVIDAKKNLIAGYRRLQALRWAMVDVTVAENAKDAAAALRAERDENTCRLDFAPSEAVALGLALEAIEKPAAETRVKAGKADPGRNLPQGQRAPRVRDVVAPAVGMSPRTYEKAKHVVATAADRTTPAPVRAAAREALAQMDETGKVDPAYKKVTTAAAAHEWDQVEKAMDDAGIDDADYKRATLQHHAAKASVAVTRQLLTLNATNVALVIDEDWLWADWLDLEQQIVAWFAEFRAARPKRLRAVK